MKTKNFKYKKNAVEFLAKISKTARKLKKRIDFVISENGKSIQLKVVKSR